MKILFTIFLLSIALFGGCNDSPLATVGEKAIKTSYDTNDKTVSKTVSNIIDSLKRDIDVEKNSLLTVRDIKNLHISGLLEIRELNSILESQKNLIFYQR